MNTAEFEAMALRCEATARELAAADWADASEALLVAREQVVANGYAIADLARTMGRQRARQDAIRWWKPWTWFA